MVREDHFSNGVPITDRYPRGTEVVEVNEKLVSDLADLDRKRAKLVSDSIELHSKTISEDCNPCANEGLSSKDVSKSEEAGGSAMACPTSHASEGPAREMHLDFSPSASSTDGHPTAEEESYWQTHARESESRVLSSGSHPPPPYNLPLIEVNNICCQWADVKVLCNISFSLSCGSLLSVVGPVGSGKLSFKIRRWICTLCACNKKVFKPKRCRVNKQEIEIRER